MNNLRFIVRMLRRNPLLVFVSLPGLAIGLSAVLLLSVYLKHELSFDQHFTTKDRVLRLYAKVVENNQPTVYGICLRKAYTDIPAKVPEVEAAVQLYGGRGWAANVIGWGVNVKNGGKQFPSMNLMYADPGFFDVFGLKLLYGNQAEALLGKGKVVLTHSVAQRIFNRDDCVGQVVYISDEPFTVSGVINDIPQTTHFSFDLLASIESIHPENFGGLEFFTYFLIRKNADTQKAGMQIAAVYNELMKPFDANFNMQTESGTELLDKIHLYSRVNFDLSPKASMMNIGIVAGIAFLVLLIAMVNYINLYVLHGEKRITEIAARKSLGATSKNLSRMFYAETGAVGLLAFALAVIIALLVQPYFARLMQRRMDISELLSPSGILIVLGFLLLLILVSGAYPSFYLSRINLVNGLKGIADRVKRKGHLFTTSVLVQFTITVFLISSLVIIHAQVRYLKGIPLGFNPEQVVGINTYSPALMKKYKDIQNELLQFPFVKSVGSSDHSMGEGCSGQGIKVYGNPGSYLSVNEYRVKPGFCETMELQLLDGRFFRDNEQDKRSVILNEAAAKMLELGTSVGTQVEMFGEPMEVIGVVKDFYYVDHPGEPIAPLVLTNYSNAVGRSYLRIVGDFTSDRQTQVASVLKHHDPDFIFGYFRLTDNYSSKFGNEERVMRLVSTGAYLAILISFMGLMALSLMNVNRRTKEIGVRKVTGSTVAEVMVTLLRQFIGLVIIACIMAFLPAYLIMQQWLGNFSDKISLHISYFLLSGFFALLIALLAVGWQSWKAATANPVEALRYE